MKSSTPSLRTATEITFWQMAFKLTLLASVFMALGLGVLFAVKSIVKLFV